MRYTVESLIERLKKFPEDLKIETELAFLWEYPEELKDIRNGYSEEYFAELTQMKATRLYIFEGDWEKGSVSDVDGKLKDKMKEMKLI